MRLPMLAGRRFPGGRQRPPLRSGGAPGRGTREDGQTSVEYAVVIVLVGLVLAGTIASGVAGDVFSGFFNTLKSVVS